MKNKLKSIGRLFPNTKSDIINLAFIATIVLIYLVPKIIAWKFNIYDIIGSVVVLGLWWGVFKGSRLAKFTLFILLAIVISRLFKLISIAVSTTVPIMPGGAYLSLAFAFSIVFYMFMLLIIKINFTAMFRDIKRVFKKKK